MLGTAGGWFFAHSGWTGVVVFFATLYALALVIALHLSRLAPLQPEG